MINYTSNIDVIIKAAVEKVKQLQSNPDPVLRAVALAVLPEVKHRVHIEGKDSTGAQIGVYSPGYMVVRTGAYKNADKFKKGKSQGQLKNSGKFTDATIKLDKNTGVYSGEEKSGTARPNYRRSTDTKVILSLTRQMENDFSVVATPTGYGLGYTNHFNFEKALWCEHTYGKAILTKLTPGELELAQKTADQFTTEYLKTF